MKHLKLFESFYRDITSEADEITKQYLELVKDYKKKKDEYIAKLYDKLDDKKSKSTASLKELNDEYLKNINECLVDVEDFYVSCIHASIDSGYRGFYRCKTSDYQIFKNTQDKINHIIGEDCYNIGYKIKSIPETEYVTPEFIESSRKYSGHKYIGQKYLPISELDEVLKDGLIDDMMVRFVFKPLTTNRW